MIKCDKFKNCVYSKAKMCLSSCMIREKCVFLPTKIKITQMSEANFFQTDQRANWQLRNKKYCLCWGKPSLFFSEENKKKERNDLKIDKYEVCLYIHLISGKFYVYFIVQWLIYYRGSFFIHYNGNLCSLWNDNCKTFTLLYI